MYDYLVLNWIYFKIYVPYHNILKLIKFVKDSNTCCIYNFTEFNVLNVCKWTIYRKKTRKLSIFTFIWIRQTVATRVRSLSKPYKLRSINMKNFLSFSQVSRFGGFWSILRKILSVRRISLLYLIINLACCVGSIIL